MHVRAMNVRFLNCRYFGDVPCGCLGMCALSSSPVVANEIGNPNQMIIVP